MDALTTRLDAWIDAHHAEQVDFLREIVRVPTDTPPGNNARAAERAAQLLEALGFHVERMPVPADVVSTHGLQSVTNLVVRQKLGAGGPTIALNAHGDVVPPGDGWTHPPYEGEVVDGKLYGRGAAVSKSDFATYTYALLALREAARHGDHFAGTVELHFTYDEEFGGLIGPGRLLAEMPTKPDYAIGAGFSYSVVTAHNGCLQLEVTVQGKSAHGAMPETGADALRAAHAILHALYADADQLFQLRSRVSGIEHATMIVGRIEGGTNTNVVPDRVTLKLDRRMVPEEDPGEVEAHLNRLIRAAAGGRPGIQVSVKRLLLARALKPLPGHEKLAQAIQAQAKRVLGEDIPAMGVPLYTDARLYGEAGVPVVLYGAGPRTILEANAKRADEHVKLSDLLAATKVIAGTIASLTKV